MGHALMGRHLLLSTGEAWRLEDDCSEPPRAPQLGTAVEDAPFSYFRSRSFYMRKSLSVDNHLGSLSYAVHPAESKAERVRTKLRRQFVSTGLCPPRSHTHGFPKTPTPWRAGFVPNISKTTEKRGCSSLLEQTAAAARLGLARDRAPLLGCPVPPCSAG